MSKSTCNGYLAHIDGVRALAILLVVLYHTKIAPIPGGFIGVDIFFVVSGFLITRIIKDGIDSGSFSYRRFYIRRAKRLFPTLFIVLLLSGGYLWKYLSPDSLVSFSKSILTALFFVSNFWFYKSSGYHAVGAEQLPLLHTWSLGVEEQFYLVFPVLFVLLYRQAMLKLATPASLFIIAIVSLCAAQYLSHSHPNFSFYTLPTRAWQLVTGALLVFVPAAKKISLSHDIALICAVGAIIFSSLWFDSNIVHPGFITAVPVLASALLIYSGGNVKTVSIILTNPVMRYIGNVSYSWYLVHFPIVTAYYLRHPDKNLTAGAGVNLLVSGFFITVVIHHLIENPLRYGSDKRFVSVCGSLFLFICGLCTYYIFSDGMRFRESHIQDVFKGTSRAEMHLIKDGKHCYDNRLGTGCQFISDSASTTLINMGDSHAYVMAPAMRRVAADLGFNYRAINMTHCPYIAHTYRATGFAAQCSVEMQQQARDHLLSVPRSIITYIVRYPLYLNPERLDNGEGGIERSLYLPFQVSDKYYPSSSSVEGNIRDSIIELADYGHLVVLVYPIPEVGWDVPQLIRSKLEGHSPTRQLEIFANLNVSTNYEVYKERAASTKAVYDSIIHNNVIKIYPDILFCDKNTSRCKTHDKKGIFYRDNNHLSQYGAAILASYIFKELQAFID